MIRKMNVIVSIDRIVMTRVWVQAALAVGHWGRRRPRRCRGCRRPAHPPAAASTRLAERPRSLRLGPRRWLRLRLPRRAAWWVLRCSFVEHPSDVVCLVLPDLFQLALRNAVMTVLACLDLRSGKGAQLWCGPCAHRRTPFLAWAVFPLQQLPRRLWTICLISSPSVEVPPHHMAPLIVICALAMSFVRL